MNIKDVLSKDVQAKQQKITALKEDIEGLHKNLDEFEIYSTVRSIILKGNVMLTGQRALRKNYRR